MATTIETAVGLVKQAIDQDRKQNYEEAARCYREALINFQAVRKTKGISKGVKLAIDQKCAQYEDRLKKLDKFLLNQADLTGLFKECVTSNVITNKLKPTEAVSSQESISSASWKGLKNCPLFLQGIEAIERGKRKDQRLHLADALQYYEDGMTMLLEAATAANLDNPEAESNNEHLRFKCLLIHERIENIRNHLESGLPLQPVRDSLDTVEYSLGVRENETVSPEPELYEESKILSMEELASVGGGSRHSLYPEVKHQQPRNKNNNSKSGSLMSLRSSLEQDSPQSIPLADMSGEFQLSSLSLASRTSMKMASSILETSQYGEADRNVTELTYANSGLDLDLYNMDNSCSSHEVLSRSDEAPRDVDEELNNEDRKDTSSRCGSSDSGISDHQSSSQLSPKSQQHHPHLHNIHDYDQAEVLIEQHKQPEEVEVGREEDRIQTEGQPLLLESHQHPQDSDDNDIAIKALDESRKSSAYASEAEEKISSSAEPLEAADPSSSLLNEVMAAGYVSENEDDKKEEGSNAKLRAVSPESVVLLVHKSLDGTPVVDANSSPARLTPPMKISPSASLKRKEKMKSLEDEVTVLSQEDVVDSAAGAGFAKAKVDKQKQHDVSVKVKPVDARPEYIPPRAFAGLEDDDEDEEINKGCYYFLSCLDSLWVL